MVRKFLKNIYAKIALHGKQLQLTQLCFKSLLLKMGASLRSWREE